MQTKKHRFPYEWNLKDAVFSKDKGTVFSCFACGGGSTMGYKLAGFDVLGCNEIDPKMMEAYITNHKPKYSYLEPIQTFKLRKDLPEELYNLDILDGSPPCSSFSMAGNREKDWGKEKKFREGQAEQVLDNLFFDFIDLAKELQPKVVIAENVKGLLLGNAKEYVRKIYREFDQAGYYCQHWLLDASKMGVPQRRERVFFICLRKDLAEPFMEQKDMFTVAPKLKLEFNEPKIPYKHIELDYGYRCIKSEKLYPSWIKRYPLVKKGKCFNTAGNGLYNCNKLDENKPIQTIVAKYDGGGNFHYSDCRKINATELRLGGSFPLDYNFLNNPIQYLIGMSVPPVVMANISEQIYLQWLKYI